MVVWATVCVIHVFNKDGSFGFLFSISMSVQDDTLPIKVQRQVDI